MCFEFSYAMGGTQGGGLHHGQHGGCPTPQGVANDLELVAGVVPQRLLHGAGQLLQQPAGSSQHAKVAVPQHHP